MRAVLRNFTRSSVGYALPTPSAYANVKGDVLAEIQGLQKAIKWTIRNVFFEKSSFLIHFLYEITAPSKTSESSSESRVAISKCKIQTAQSPRNWISVLIIIAPKHNLFWICEKFVEKMKLSAVFISALAATLIWLPPRKAFATRTAPAFQVSDLSVAHRIFTRH